jgi:RNA polymerase sigma-70 factor (ECF subfamily)
VSASSAVRRADEYDDLFRRHHARVLRLCQLLLRDRDEAEDVTQEVFLTLHREQARGERRVGWAPWLTRVAVNACHHRRRSRWWRVWRAEPAAVDPAELSADTPTPETATIDGERRGAILDVFHTLSVRQQEIFILRHVEGYATEDVATMLGLHSGSVKRHLYRATHAFQRALRARPGGRP